MSGAGGEVGVLGGRDVERGALVAVDEGDAIGDFTVAAPDPQYITVEDGLSPRG